MIEKCTKDKQNSIILHHSEFKNGREHGVDGGEVKTICVHSSFSSEKNTKKSVDFSLSFNQVTSNLKFHFPFFFLFLFTICEIHFSSRCENFIRKSSRLNLSRISFFSFSFASFSLPFSSTFCNS